MIYPPNAYRPRGPYYKEINRNFYEKHDKFSEKKYVNNYKMQNNSNGFESKDVNNMNNSNKNNNKNYYEQYFEIFGIKLYFDDLLILALLFFLYKEEVQDNTLFIILLLLLLN